jgi:hypothetical protein
MTPRPAHENASTPRRRWTTSAVALAGACVALLSTSLDARAVKPPPVPADLEVDAGYKAFRIDHAVGTQNYMCLPSGEAFAWTPIGPQATLFNPSSDRQSATHYLSANPDEEGAFRPTWQDSRDTSAIWGAVVEDSTDPAFVDPDAVAWLLLRVVGKAAGPTGGIRLARSQYIQRVNTVGGKPPVKPCTEDNLGERIFVPYETDYVFYKATGKIE